MITNPEIKEAIINDLMDLRLSFLICISAYKEEGITASELTKVFPVSYAHASLVLNRLERQDYIKTIAGISKREKRRVLTEKTYTLFKIMGEL